MKTPLKHSMNPPVRWLFLASRIGAALLLAVLLTGLWALVAWQAPSAGWVWSIGWLTLALTVALLIRDVIHYED